MMNGVSNRSDMQSMTGKIRRVAVSHFEPFIAQRNPIVRSSKSGSADSRAVTRKAAGKSAQDPPRITRLSPAAGPDGFFSELC